MEADEKLAIVKEEIKVLELCKIEVENVLTKYCNLLYNRRLELEFEVQRRMDELFNEVIKEES